MLNRVHHGHDPDTSLLAVAHGPQTVALWKLDNEASGEAEAANSREPDEGRKPDLCVPTERSALRGLCFVGASTLLTVHVSGAVVGWRLPVIGDEADDEQNDEPEVIWELQVGFEPCAFDVFGRYVHDAFHLAVGGKGGQLAILSPDGTDEPAVALQENAHKSDITALAFSSSGGRLASAGRDRLINLWTIDSPADASDTALDDPETLVGCEAWPLCLSFSHDGSRLVSGCMDNGIYLWELDAAAADQDDDPLLAAVFEHHGWVVDVAWSPDGSVIAAASWDNSIGIYEADGLVPTHSLEYHRDYVSSLYFVADSPYLISGSYDQTLGVWNWQQPSLEQRMHAHSDWVLGVRPLDEGQFVSLSSDKTIQRWSGEDFSWLGSLGESVASNFELGGDSGLIDFVAGETSNEDDPTQSRVRIEKPRDASRAVREVRRRNDDEHTGVKTPMRMLDKVLDEPETTNESSEPLLDDALDEAADEQLEAALDDATSQNDEPAADQQLDAALDDATSQNDEPAADQQLDAALDDATSQEEEPAADEQLDAALDDAADEEHDDAADEIALQEFLDSVPDDFGLDSISSVNEMVDAGYQDEADSVADSEAGSAANSEADSEDEADDEPDNPFAESPETQNIARSRIEETVAADGRANKPSGSADEPVEPAAGKEDLKNRLKFGLQKLKKRTQQHAAAKRREQKPATDEPDADEPVADEPVADEPVADEPVADEPAADEPDEQKPDDPAEDEPTPLADGGAASDVKSKSMGREVSTSHVDLGMDRDVASVFDDLIPDPEEASPPSLGADNEQLDSDEPEEDEEEIVDEIYGNTTRLGMPSEVAENPDDMSHHSTDDDNTNPGIKRFRLGNAPEENAAQRFLQESSGNEVSEAVVEDELDDDPDWAEWGDQLSSNGGGGRGIVDQDLPAGEQGGLSKDEDTAARSTSLASEFATPAQDVQTPAQEDDKHDHTQKVDPSSLNALRTGVFKPAGGGRLSPGDSDASDLQVPEPSEASEANDGPEVIETEMGDLWERRSAASAPGMGIIKRALAADTLYKRVQEIDTPHRQTLGVDLHAKSKLVASCGADNSVVIWGFDGTKRHEFHIDHEGLNDVLFSPDGTMLLAGGTDALVHAWLIPPKTLAKAETVRHAVLDAHQGRLTSLAISSNGKVLLSGSYDGTARAWHLPDGELGATLDGECGPVRGVAFEDKTLLSAGQDGAVRVWNPTGLQIDQLDGFGNLSHLAASPAGSMWGNTDGRVYVGGSDGPRALVSHDDAVSAVDLQKDGAAASAGADGFVHLYTPGSDKPFQSLELPSPVRGLARDNDYLAVGTDAGKIYLYRRG